VSDVLHAMAWLEEQWTLAIQKGEHQNRSGDKSGGDGENDKAVDEARVGT